MCIVMNATRSSFAPQHRCDSISTILLSTFVLHDCTAHESDVGSAAVTVTRSACASKHHIYDECNKTTGSARSKLKLKAKRTNCRYCAFIIISADSNSPLGSARIRLEFALSLHLNSPEFAFEFA